MTRSPIVTASDQHVLPGFPGSIDSLGATSIKVQLGPMYTLSPKETLNPCHTLSIVSQLSRVIRESLTYSRVKVGMTDTLLIFLN